MCGRLILLMCFGLVVLGVGCSTCSLVVLVTVRCFVSVLLIIVCGSLFHFVSVCIVSFCIRFGLVVFHFVSYLFRFVFVSVWFVLYSVRVGIRFGVVHVVIYSCLIKKPFCAPSV